MRGYRLFLFADPFGLPSGGVLLRIAARAIVRDQLAGDLLPVPRRAARDLVGADVQLPLRPGPLYPGRRAGVLEREPLRGQVLRAAHVDHRVAVPRRVRLAGDRVNRGDRGRGPAGEQAWALERV